MVRVPKYAKKQNLQARILASIITESKIIADLLSALGFTRGFDSDQCCKGLNIIYSKARTITAELPTIKLVDMTCNMPSRLEPCSAREVVVEREREKGSGENLPGSLCVGGVFVSDSNYSSTKRKQVPMIMQQPEGNPSDGLIMLELVNDCVRAPCFRRRFILK